MARDWQLWTRGEVLLALDGIEPRLASWNANTDPAQVRLQAYLDEVERSVRPVITGRTGLYLHLDVDVRDPSRLLRGYDVENYLTPIVHRLRAERFSLVSGRKVVGGGSRLTVGLAIPLVILAEPETWEQFDYTAGANSQHPNWKAGLRAALIAADARPLPPGPVEVQLAWRCAPHRNWAALWKATGDAMGPILGEPDTRNPFNPGDDRIVALDLHLNLDPAIGHSVDVGIWWRPLAGAATWRSEPRPPRWPHPEQQYPLGAAIRRELKSEGGFATGPTDAPLAARRVATDVELQQLHSTGRGLIYNDFSGSSEASSTYNVLHAAGCRWLERSNTNIRKWFFVDLTTASDWLVANRGPEGQRWRRCGTCHAMNRRTVDC
jgi:hypothetical protein